MSELKIDPELIRRAPESTDRLKELLFEGLGWPIPPDMEPEEVPMIDWSPDDLHLDPDSVANLTAIQQLPKLEEDQPFGVFFLTFSGGRLPVGAVRRVVNKLVRTKRARRKSADALWNLNDLIFFCQSEDGVATVHVVAFHDTGANPVMKVISWSTDATDNRIALVATSNLPELAWPTMPLDAAAWRERWNNAFTATYRQGVRTASALASRMAEVAQVVRDEVLALYGIETESGPLRRLFGEIKQSLRDDLDEHSFADMYAQTMVYGLLASRITHPEDFQADAVNAVLRFENPFLDSLYASFRSTGDEAFDVDEFGLRDLGELLARTDVDQILADVGTDNRRDDPVVFFFEEFLAKYDQAQRKRLGTYYTPVPVVRFMVDMVDEVLKTDLDLPEGIADGSTWSEYSSRTGRPVPDGVDPGETVVTMVDPATGTGTFLLEWYRKIAQWVEIGSSNLRPTEIVDRMAALEISLSAYAIAHLKTSLEIPPDSRRSVNLRICLADTLGASEGERPLTLLEADPLAEEATRAEEIKSKHTPLVVIGNPPYLRNGLNAKTYGATGWFRGVFNAWREGTAGTGGSLFDPYIGFWAWACAKYVPPVDSPGRPGVVCFITNRSWVDGLGFAAMRRWITRNCSRVVIGDFGHSSRAGGAGTWSSQPFNIETGTAVVLLVFDPGASRSEGPDVTYRRAFWADGQVSVGVEERLSPESEVFVPSVSFRSLIEGVTTTNGVKTSDDRRWVACKPGDQRSIRCAYRAFDNRWMPAVVPPRSERKRSSQWNESNLYAKHAEHVAEGGWYVTTPSGRYTTKPGPALHATRHLPDSGAFAAAGCDKVIHVASQCSMPTGYSKWADKMGLGGAEFWYYALAAANHAGYWTENHELSAQLSDRRVEIPLSGSAEVVAALTELGRFLLDNWSLDTIAPVEISGSEGAWHFLDHGRADQIRVHGRPVLKKWRDARPEPWTRIQAEEYARTVAALLAVRAAADSVAEFLG